MTTLLLLTIAMISARPVPTVAPNQAPTFEACESRVRATSSFADWLCFAEVARGTGRFDEAAAHVQRLLVGRPQDALGWFALALIHEDQGSAEAISDYRKALVIFAEIGDEPRVLWTHLAVANVALNLGRLDEAEEAIGLAETVMPTDRPADPYARLLIAQGRLAYYRGDYGTSLRRFQAAADPAQSSSDLEAQRLSGMGAVFWATGRAAQAEEYYLREAELLSRAGAAGREASARVNLALITLTLRRPLEELRQRAVRALAVAETGGNRSAAGRAHGYLSEASTGPQAIAHAEQSLELLSDVPADLPLGLRTLAKALLDSDPARAFALADRAIAEARRQGNSYEVARSLVIRSRMRWEAGSRDVAIADSLATLDAIESTRLLQTEADVRALRFASWGNPYSELAANLLGGTGADDSSDADRDLAFEVIERARARMLLDSFDVTESASARFSESVAEHDRILQNIVEVQRRLVGSPLSGTGREAALSDLERLEREERELRSRVTPGPPDGAPATTFASVGDVRTELREDEAFIAVFGDWVFVHTRRETRVYEQPAISAAQRVGLFNRLVERRDGSESAAATRFHQDLLAAVLEDLPSQTTRLIISPDARLQVLPFDLLRPSAAAPPLVATHVVSIVPSATTWLRWRRASQPAVALRAYVAADPAVAAGDGSDGHRQWTLTGGVGLGRLPSARQEARMIARTIPATRMALGEDATEYAFKQLDLADYGLLHFATHSVIDNEYPERSAIVLAPGAPGEDGLLQAREIVDLDLAGRVVLLSACQSASGQIVGGEGVLGLTHAFFQAGARAVVASTWPLEDTEAAELFGAFYDELSRGATLASALAQAKRRRIGAGAPPAAWAGVTVFGDGAFAPIAVPAFDHTSRVPAPAALGTLAMVLLLSTVIAVLVFRRRSAAR